jgi:hypothetical protein
VAGEGRKVGVVVLGYLAAVLVASAAVGVRLVTTRGPDTQSSSGMYAFGDALLFVGVFGVVALVPTGAALVFLRPYRHFWTAVSALGVAVALTGLAAAVVFAVGRHAAASSLLTTWAGLSVPRILVAPIFALTFVVFAALSPHRAPRLAFLAAAVAEAAVSASGAIVWSVPLLASWL